MRAEEIYQLTYRAQNDRFSEGDNIVLLTFDDNYMDQSVNLILSIARYHPTSVSFVCICPPLRQENYDILLGLSQGVQIRSYVGAEDLSSGRWVSGAVLRLFCPWLLEESFHKLVYMDSDILCTGKLDVLFEADIPLVGMCSEISGNVSPGRLEVIRPMMPSQIYCNSGVLAMNLDGFRQGYTFGQIYEGVRALHGKVCYLDQDFLNIYFQGKITVLNPFFFNFQAYELRKTEFYKHALRQCSLIHFSVGKPWLYKTRLRFILLYLKHSEYPPMIRKVRRTLAKSIAYSPIRIARRIASHMIHFFD